VNAVVVEPQACLQPRAAAGQVSPAVMIGLLSDAHGNPLGLRSCLAALRAAGAAQVYFLGDAVGYLPGEAEVIEILRSEGVICQRGNHEGMLLGDLDLDPGRDRVYGLAAVRERMPPEVGAVLAGADGHRPDTSTAWSLIAVIAAACNSGVLPRALAGGPGSAPGTNPSGLDHDAAQKPNGTAGSAAPTAFWSSLAAGPA